MVGELRVGEGVSISPAGRIAPAPARGSAQGVVHKAHGRQGWYEVLLVQGITLDGFHYAAGTYLNLPAGEPDVPPSLDRPAVEAWLDA